MRFAKIDADLKKSTVFFAITGIIYFLIASSVLPFFGTFSNTPCPDLLFCLVCVIPAYYDKKLCCIYAVLLGFLSDLFINTPFLFSPIVYLAAVVGVMYFYRFFKNFGTITASVCAMPVLAARQVLGTVIVMNVRQGANLGNVLIKVIVPEFFISFAFILVTGFLIRCLTRFFDIQKIQ
ncbi:MAG: hypothetical protein J6K12_04655 [Clostridia bacterium]|nr:hypothetical protein [Clostridia bacterium]